MTSVPVDVAATVENESTESPLPLALCWSIWIMLSAGLWVAVWRIATFFF